MTNVKKIGNDFEKEFEKLMRDNGFWVHFCAPNAAGAQPCDFVAAKWGRAYLIDCKTCEKSRFSVSRLEVNQVNAFRKFFDCANSRGYIAVKHEGEIYMLDAYDAIYEGRTYFVFAEKDKFENWVDRQ